MMTRKFLLAVVLGSPATAPSASGARDAVPDPEGVSRFSVDQGHSAMEFVDEFVLSPHRPRRP
jgi:hypothetical protein